MLVSPPFPRLLVAFVLKGGSPSPICGGLRDSFGGTRFEFVKGAMIWSRDEESSGCLPAVEKEHLKGSQMSDRVGQPDFRQLRIDLISDSGTRIGEVTQFL